MQNPTKTALTIAGSDSCGGAGIQADLKTFAAIGIHGTSVITAITAQNTRKIYDIMEIPLQMINQQFSAIFNDFQISFAKTGMLYSKNVIELVSKKIEEYKFNLILDPVIFAGSGSRLLKEDAENALIKSLFPKTHVVTPNIIEAGKITSQKIQNIEDMKDSAIKIKELGPKAVLIKGGHLKSEKIADILYFEDEFTSFEKNKIKNQMHGTGCTLSAAITAYLTLDNSIQEAVAKAEDFIDLAIQNPIITNSGIFPVNPLAKLELEAARFVVIENIKSALKKIEKQKKFSQLIPEVRSNIAMAILNPKSVDYIASVEGRITIIDGYPEPVGNIHFGGVHHLPRLLISAKQYEPSINAVMNIRYSPEIFRACKNTNLSIIKIDREQEPIEKVELEGKSMSWIIEETAKLTGGKIPDLICDEGTKGKEAMIRIFGISAIEVVNKALQILKNLG